MLPGIAGQSGFDTGFCEKLFSVPAPFHSHLRQKQPSLRSARNQQTMPAHFNLLRINVQQGRQYGDFELQ